jgi:hypothetical protein
MKHDPELHLHYLTASSASNLVNLLSHKGGKKMPLTLDKDNKEQALFS